MIFTRMSLDSDCPINYTKGGKVDYEHLRNELGVGYSYLSDRLQKILRYAMRHLNEISLETIAVIARRAEVLP